jgi:putative FmdB family regulatory protein
MPRYDYICRTCEVQEEVSKSYSEYERKEICSSCGNEMVRAINMPNFAGCFPTRQGWDKDKEKKDNKELDSYYSAVKQGIEPISTKQKDIDAAVRLSNEASKAFDGNTLAFKE